MKKDLKGAKKAEELPAVEVKKVDETLTIVPDTEQPAEERFYTYYRQLRDVSLEKTTTGILLECLLDDIESEKLLAVEQEDAAPPTDNEMSSINSILAGLNDFVTFSQSNAVLKNA